MEAIEVLKSIWNSNSGIDKFRYLASGIVWQIRKRSGHSFVKKIHTGGLIKVFPSSSYSSIFYNKWPECEEQKFIRKFRKLAAIFVDVGANVGIFSMHMIDCFNSFYLFEPSPSTFKALQETCKLNTQVRWHLYNIGIGDEKGSFTFLEEENLSSTSRFCDANMHNSEKSKKISVKIDLLDNVIPSHIGNIILKVDVEGFEEKVFRGSHRIFSEKQARLVMFERLERTNLQNIKDFFLSHNYDIFAVQKNGRITTDNKIISIPLINLFATPKEIFSGLLTGNIPFN